MFSVTGEHVRRLSQCSSRVHVGSPVGRRSFKPAFLGSVIDESAGGPTYDGRIFDFARNAVAGFEGNEFAGACFAQRGQTLYVNIQTPGITFAIWGPWAKGAL